MPGPYHSADHFAKESIEIYESWMHRLNKCVGITTEEYDSLATKYFNDHLDRLEKQGIVFTKKGFAYKKEGNSNVQ